MPPHVIDVIDVIAARENRSRAKMIELVLRRFDEQDAERKAAA